MIEHFCNRAFLMERGKLVMSGSTNQVFCKYLSNSLSDKCQFLGSIPRRRDLRPIIQKVELINDYGHSMNAVAAGSAVFICIHYQNSEPISDAYFTLTAETGSGLKIFKTEAKFQKMGSSGLPSSGVLRCHIARVPLIPGTYFTSIDCGTGNLQLDFLSRVCQLDVTRVNVFEMNYLFDRGNGTVLLDATWDVKNERSMRRSSVYRE